MEIKKLKSKYTYDKYKNEEINYCNHCDTTEYMFKAKCPICGETIYIEFDDNYDYWNQNKKPKYMDLEVYCNECHFHKNIKIEKRR